ncbi:MAG: hypothetical protein MJ060_01910 [Clostridia bacterium]|nr:hypothetical protein [Clostridia bacterium]
MFRRKLTINLIVVLVCGTIAVSLPIIVNHLQKPTHADNGYQIEETLISLFVGDQFQDKLDTYAIWQLELRRGEKVLENWQQIYTTITTDSSLIVYNQDQLKLTNYGLICRDKQTTAQFQAVVTYQGHSCTLVLP